MLEDGFGDVTDVDPIEETGSDKFWQLYLPLVGPLALSAYFKSLQPLENFRLDLEPHERLKLILLQN